MRTPTIQLCSGKFINLLEPDPSLIQIDDIAASLSRLCRFTGHLKDDLFYSVAEHSVRGSYLVEHGYELEFLLHDGHEYITGDMNSPLKQLCPDFQIHANRIQAAICARFDLPENMSIPVHVTDYRMLATEKRDLLRVTTADVNEWAFLQDFPPYSERIDPWAPSVARRAFINRYYELIGYPVKWAQSCS